METTLHGGWSMWGQESGRRERLRQRPRPAPMPGCRGVRGQVDVHEALHHAWALLCERPLVHVAAFLILAVGSAASAGLLFGPLLVGYIRLIDRQLRGSEVRARELLQGLRSFLPATGVLLLLLAAVAAGLAALIVPGLVLLAGFSLAPWFVALKNHRPLAALLASLRLVRRRAASLLIVLMLMTALVCAGVATVLASLFCVPLALIVATVSFRELVR